MLVIYLTIMSNNYYWESSQTLVTAEFTNEIAIPFC